MNTATIVLMLLMALLALLAGLGVGYAVGRNRSDARFADLAADALRHNNDQFLSLAGERLSRAGQQQTAALAPVQDTLARVESELRRVESARQEAYGRLHSQVEAAQRSSEELRHQTATLAAALTAPRARGRWGEMQLRRVVELAGMTNHVSFSEQVTVTVDGQDLRPDLVVHLPGEKHCVVDAKVPLDAYLKASDCSDDAQRQALLRDHARALRSHVRALSGKAYWKALDGTPDFVILFVPSEAFLAAAFDADPALVEEAMASRVVVSTPQTLVATLHAVSYAWQQDTLADNARQVFVLGRELTDRLRTFSNHLGKLGTALGTAVGSYNSAVGSLDTRVLVTARKLDALGVSSGEVTPPDVVDSQARQPALRLADRTGVEDPHDMSA